MGHRAGTFFFSYRVEHGTLPDGWCEEVADEAEDDGIATCFAPFFEADLVSTIGGAWARWGRLQVTFWARRRGCRGWFCRAIATPLGRSSVDPFGPVELSNFSPHSDSA